MGSNDRKFELGHHGEKREKEKITEEDDVTEPRMARRQFLANLDHSFPTQTESARNYFGDNGVVTETFKSVRKQCFSSVQTCIVLS